MFLTLFHSGASATRATLVARISRDVAPNQRIMATNETTHRFQSSRRRISGNLPKYSWSRSPNVSAANAADVAARWRSELQGWRDDSIGGAIGPGLWLAASGAYGCNRAQPTSPRRHLSFARNRDSVKTLRIAPRSHRSDWLRVLAANLVITRLFLTTSR